jgi:hypothetical protein
MASRIRATESGRERQTDRQTDHRRQKLRRKDGHTRCPKRRGNSVLVAAADNHPPLSQISSSRILDSREQQRKVIVCWICMWMNKKTPAYQPGTHSQKAACLISVNRQARALTSVRAAQCRPRRKCPLSNLLRKERQALFSTNGRSVLAFPYAPTRWPASYLFSLTLFVPLFVTMRRRK